MASNDDNPESWDEAQYIAALARLERLHDAVTALRTTIPSLISPIMRPTATKQSAFIGMKKAAIGAVTDVKQLRKEWESDQLNDVLRKSKESYEKDPDLIKANDVMKWGWVEEDQKVKDQDKVTADGTG